MANILLVQWSGSAYDSLRALLDLVAVELVDDGHFVDRVVIGQDGCFERLRQLIDQRQWDIALGMSGIGIETTINGRSLWEDRKIPFFTWFCDHPAHFPSRHVVSSPYTVLGYVFPDHARYTRDHLNPNGTTFAVHLGMPSRSVFADAPRVRHKRNGRIIFCKSGGSPGLMRAKWRQSLSPLLVTILEEAAEEAESADVASLTWILCAAAERHDLFLAPDGKLCLTLLSELDHHERARRANLVMHSLLDLPMDVYGANWGHIDWQNKRAAHHAHLGFNEMIARLPEYLGSVSINPLVSESVHDRVFFALAAGVTPLTDTNQFFRTHMPKLGRYGFHLTPDNIVAAAEAVIAYPDTALERTEATYQALMPRFTLRQSARRIIAFCELRPHNQKA